MTQYWILIASLVSSGAVVLLLMKRLRNKCLSMSMKNVGQVVANESIIVPVYGTDL